MVTTLTVDKQRLLLQKPLVLPNIVDVDARFLMNVIIVSRVVSVRMRAARHDQVAPRASFVVRTDRVHASAARHPLPRLTSVVELAVADQLDVHVRVAAAAHDKNPQLHAFHLLDRDHHPAETGNTIVDNPALFLTFDVKDAGFAIATRLGLHQDHATQLDARLDAADGDVVEELADGLHPQRVKLVEARQQNSHDPEALVELLRQTRIDGNEISDPCGWKLLCLVCRYRR